MNPRARTPAGRLAAIGAVMRNRGADCPASQRWSGKMLQSIG